MYKREVYQGMTEGQLASIVASATDAIISTSVDQRIILFNGAAEAMFLHTAADIMGQPLNVLIPGRFHEVHRRHIDAFGQSGITARSMHSPGQLVGLRSNGEEFPIEAMISQADTECGRVYAVIIRDITERVRADSARQEFLAMLGHELRNPLATISNAVFTLRERVDDPALTRTLAILDRQTTHMKRLVSDLVDLSRVTRGVLGLQCERVDLSTAIEGAVEPFQPQFEARQIHLAVTLPDEPLQLWADPVRLHQVLSNLLDNALKYGYSGGNVWLNVHRHGDFAVVTIRDTGEGISSDLLPLLFEPFIQGKHRSEHGHGGLGIGLTLCHRIIELHGGTLSATSEGSGKGAEFTVRLPLEGTPALSGCPES